MNVAISWVIAPCSPYVTRRFERKKKERKKERLGGHLLHAGFLLG
jgi:hypothetical protein